MERPRPTSQLIIEMCGEDYDMLSSLRKGLDGMPFLKEIYPSLDLNELVAFAPSAWKLKEKGVGCFIDAVNSGDVCYIFDGALRVGKPWLNHRKNLRISSPSFDERLNPYKGQDLHERISKASYDVKKRFAAGMQDFIRYNGKHEIAKALCEKGNIRFKNERTIPALGVGIASTLSNYPRSYSPIYNPSEEKRVYVPSKPSLQLERSLVGC